MGYTKSYTIGKSFKITQKSDSSLILLKINSDIKNFLLIYSFV